MHQLSAIEFIEGDLQAALRLMNDSISTRGTTDDVIQLAYKFNMKSMYLIALGRYDEAHRLACEALTESAARPRSGCLAFSLYNLASIAALSPESNPDDRSTQILRAARTFGFAEKLFAISCNGKRHPLDQWLYDINYTALRGAMSEAELRHFMSLGAQQTSDEAIRDALMM